MTVLLNWLGILLVTNENPLVSFRSLLRTWVNRSTDRRILEIIFNRFSDPAIPEDCGFIFFFFFRH